MILGGSARPNCVVEQREATRRMHRMSRSFAFMLACMIRAWRAEWSSNRREITKPPDMRAKGRRKRSGILELTGAIAKLALTRRDCYRGGWCRSNDPSLILCRGGPTAP
jgi:hypothetical protein